MKQSEVAFNLCLLLSRMGSDDYTLGEVEPPFVRILKNGVSYGAAMRPASAIRRLSDKICAESNAD